MLPFILYNVLESSDKNIVICQQYTYSPEPHMGSIFNAYIIGNLVKCYFTYDLIRLWLVDGKVTLQCYRVPVPGE